MSWIVGGAAVARLGLERPSPARPTPAPAQTRRKAERVISPLENLSDASEIAVRRRRSPESMSRALLRSRSLKAEGLFRRCPIGGAPSPVSGIIGRWAAHVHPTFVGSRVPARAAPRPR